MKLSTYDVILGKSWMDRRNPDIDWRVHTVKINVRKSIVELNRVQEVERKEKFSSISSREIERKEISTQCKQPLAQKEPVYLAVVRLVENDDDRKELSDDSIVEINEDNTKTPYLKEVKKILLEYVGIFLKYLPTRWPPQTDVDRMIELVPRAEPPHEAPYRMPPQGIDELKNQLQDLTEMGYIQCSISTF